MEHIIISNPMDIPKTHSEVRDDGESPSPRHHFIQPYGPLNGPTIYQPAAGAGSCCGAAPPPPPPLSPPDPIRPPRPNVNAPPIPVTRSMNYRAPSKVPLSCKISGIHGPGSHSMHTSPLPKELKASVLRPEDTYFRGYPAF